MEIENSSQCEISDFLCSAALWGVSVGSRLPTIQVRILAPSSRARQLLDPWRLDL